MDPKSDDKCRRGPEDRIQLGLPVDDSDDEFDIEMIMNKWSSWMIQYQAFRDRSVRSNLVGKSCTCNPWRSEKHWWVCDRVCRQRYGCNHVSVFVTTVFIVLKEKIYSLFFYFNHIYTKFTTDYHSGRHILWKSCWSDFNHSFTLVL